MTSLLAPSARGWTVEPKFGTAAASVLARHPNKRLIGPLFINGMQV
jgi:hypothetical protein